MRPMRFVCSVVDSYGCHHFLISQSRRPHLFRTNILILRLFCSISHDVCPQDEKTPLIHAAEGNHETVVDALLEAGADVNAADKVRVFVRRWLRCPPLLYVQSMRARQFLNHIVKVIMHQLLQMFILLAYFASPLTGVDQNSVGTCRQGGPPHCRRRTPQSVSRSIFDDSGVALHSRIYQRSILPFWAQVMGRKAGGVRRSFSSSGHMPLEIEQEERAIQCKSGGSMSHLQTKTVHN